MAGKRAVTSLDCHCTNICAKKLHDNIIAISGNLEKEYSDHSDHCNFVYYVFISFLANKS